MSDVITLSNVSITHPGASTPTLRNINLTVAEGDLTLVCLLYTSPSPRDKRQSRMPSSA